MLCMSVKVDLFNAFVDIGTGRQIWFFTEKTWYYVLASRLLRNHLIKKSLRTPGCRGYRPPSPPLCTSRFPGPPGSPACLSHCKLSTLVSISVSLSLFLSFFFINPYLASLSLSSSPSSSFFFVSLSLTLEKGQSQLKTCIFPILVFPNLIGEKLDTICDWSRFIHMPLTD